MMTDIQIPWIPVQLAPKLGINTMIMTGCPDTVPEQQRFVHDHDLDGILNNTDQCPLDPEDYDGDRDEDGCPDN